MASSRPNQPGVSNNDEMESADYKTRLDEAATKKSPEPPQSEEHNGGVGSVIADKVSQYIPAASKVLGKEEKPEEITKKVSPGPGPPNRPDHDTQIEEFVRDQHRSMPVTDLDE